MSAKQRRTKRDERRRSFSQNFVRDRRQIDRLLDAACVEPGDLVVEIGPGRGALTLPLARKAKRLIAIEADPDWAQRLQERIDDQGLTKTVEVLQADFREVAFPDEPFRVVSNPPFGLTTALFERLFDHPNQGPWRADLLVQYEVAAKRAANPPTSLRSSAWAPWWEFEIGPVVPARAFRPVLSVDAALLTAHRRDQPILAEWLSPSLRELLRPGWRPPTDR